MISGFHDQHTNLHVLSHPRQLSRLGISNAMQINNIKDTAGVMKPPKTLQSKLSIYIQCTYMYTQIMQMKALKADCYFQRKKAELP